MTPYKSKSKRPASKTIKTSKSQTSRMSNFAQDVATGLRESIHFVQGVGKARTTIIEISTPAPAYGAKEVVSVRTKLGLSQKRFAKLMNVSTTSIEGWESGLKKPGPATRRLLQILSDPQMIKHAAKLHGLRVVKSVSKD